MKKDEYSFSQVEPGVWHIIDYRKDSMYLVEGEREALLIDTGMGEGDLKALVNSITKKPLSVLITHAHWDHIMQADQFEKVYLNHRDISIIELFKLKVPVQRFMDVREGHVFDLGGRFLEVVEVPGHTPGSIVLIDRQNKLLFSGDAIGAGHTWMHLPGCLPLAVYLGSLERLLQVDGFEKIYHGHLTESKIFDVQHLKDLIEAVRLVVEGKLVGQPYNFGNFEGLYVTHRSAVLVYDPTNVR